MGAAESSGKALRLKRECVVPAASTSLTRACLLFTESPGAPGPTVAFGLSAAVLGKVGAPCPSTLPS